MLQYILSRVTHLHISDWIPWLKLEQHKYIHVWNTARQLSTDSIPPFPPPMPSLSQPVHQTRKSGHYKGSFNEASNSMCIVEPPSFISTHEDFDESSVCCQQELPVSEGGFLHQLPSKGSSMPSANPTWTIGQPTSHICQVTAWICQSICHIRHTTSWIDQATT